MKIKKSIYIMILILSLVLSLAGCAKQEVSEEVEFRVVASFYPVYIMGLNIVDGIQGVGIDNMTDNLSRMFA